MNWINYLLQTNLYLLCFYALYIIAYQRETYFSANRMYLIAFTGISFLIPFWQSGMIQSWFITQKVSEQITSLGLSELIQSNYVSVSLVQTEQTWTTTEVLFLIYLIGVGIAVTKLIYDLFILNRFMKQTTKKGMASSFLGTIKIDEKLPHQEVLHIHESLHNTQKHTFDLILVAIVKVVCWFNPVVYLLQIEFKKIHEFLADANTAAIIGSKKEYAAILVGSQFQTTAHSFIHNFYEKATLKTRLMMLARKKSTKRALLKYGLIAPAFIGTLILASSFVGNSSSRILSTENINEVPSVISQFFEDKIDIRGQVKDNEGEVLPGASIKIIGSDRLTTTDVNGNFSISEVQKGATLQVAFVGFEPIEVVVNTTYLEVSLQLTPYKLEEVVVSSYEENLPYQSKVVSRKASLANQPEYPGGTPELYRFIAGNLKYPPLARSRKIEGAVVVNFTIDKEGNASNPVIIQGLGNGCDEEVKRIVDIMPLWKPARQNGREVNVKYEMMVKFVMEKASLSAESQNLAEKDELIFTAVESNPEFVGGVKKMYEYIGQNMKYPAAAMKAGVEGRVFVKFVVRKDGSIDDIQILRALGHGCEDEAKRILKSMPPWIPGYQNGKPVNVYFTMPFQFKLKDTPEAKKENAPEMLYYINGNRSTSEKAQELVKAQNIQGMNMLKDKKATDKYGDEGKNGVVELWTKGAKMPTNISKVSMTPKIDKKIYIVDGEKMTAEDIKTIPPDQIDEVVVLKGSDATSIYGQQGKDGVVKIKLKEAKVTNIPYSEGNKKLKGMKSDQSGTFANPTFVVDGVKMSKEEYQALDLKADQIENINTLKSAKAAEKYGKGAVGGVIEVTLKISGGFEELISQRPFDTRPIPESMLIIIDGKESSRTELGKIPNGQIKHFTKYNGKKAVRKYGEKAKGGVYVFTLKK